MKRDYDLVISGAGPVGLAAALAARAELGRRCRVALCDPGAGRSALIRTYAISNGPKRLLTRIGAWRRIKAPQPILRMDITDSRLEDIVRQSYLQFEVAREAHEPLAWMATERDLMEALAAEAHEGGIEIRTDSITSFAAIGSCGQVGLASGEILSAGVVLACDGSGSLLRDLAHIPTIGWSYDREAIVATVEAEVDHGGAAIQHFLPAGTFALLPLQGRRFSTVWVEKPDDARHLCALAETEFMKELQDRAGNEFGALTLQEGPQRFPLKLQIARQFTSERLVLIGDAAHTMHPLAGQGLNLGLEDIGYLMEAFRSRTLLGLDMGTAESLRAYERSRWRQTTRMLALTDAMFKLFTTDVLPMRPLRDAGLALVDNLPRLKNFLIAEASGDAKHIPRLLRSDC